MRQVITLFFCCFFLCLFCLGQEHAVLPVFKETSMMIHQQKYQIDCSKTSITSRNLLSILPDGLYVLSIKPELSVLYKNKFSSLAYMLQEQNQESLNQLEQQLEKKLRDNGLTKEATMVQIRGFQIEQIIIVGQEEVLIQLKQIYPDIEYHPVI